MIEVLSLRGGTLRKGPDHGLLGDSARLEALYRYCVLDTQPEQVFDEITRLAALLCGRPIALISLVDSDRQWFKSCVGMEAVQTSVEESICAIAIENDELLEVADTLDDPRFSENPLVLGTPGIRAYAGAPLTTSTGHRIGTLCVMDRVPGALSASQREGLELLARQVVRALDSRMVAVEYAEKADFKRAILLCAAESMISTTLDGTITTFNPAAERLTGWSAAEMIGLRTPCDFHDLDEVRARAAKLSIELGETVEPGFDAFVAKARRGTPETQVWTYVRKDGSRVPVLLTVSAVHNSFGEPTGFLGIARDVSKSCLLLENLSIANFELAEAQRIARIGSCHADTETGECRWSEEGHRILGIQPGKPISAQDFVELLHPEDAETFANAVNLWYTGTSPLDYELRVIANGQMKWVRICASACPSRLGQPGTVFATIQDITERRIQEQCLRDSEDMLKRTGQIAGVGGWELELSGRTVQWTLQTFRIYELPENHVPVVDDLLRFYPQAARATVSAAFEHAATTGEGWDLELPLVTSRGRHIWVRSTGEAKLHEGVPIALFGHIKDITERKLAMLRASAANRAQEEFLSSGSLGQSARPLVEAASLISHSEVAFMLRFEHLDTGQIGVHCLAAHGAAWELIKPTFCILGELLNLDILDHSTALGGILHAATPTYLNLPCDDRLPTTFLISGVPLRSIAAVPIEAGGPPVGVLCVANCAQQFTAGDTAALAPLVATAAQLIQADGVATQLEEERERLADVIEGTNAGIWEWNFQSGEATFNERWAEIAGYTLDLLQPVNSATWVRLCHPEDLRRANGIIQRVFLRKLDYYDVEIRVRHKDGQWIWIHDRGKVVEWTGDGKPLRMSGTRTDINARKILDEEYRQHTEQTTAILDSVYDGIITIGADGTMTSFSPSAERILGYRAEEVLGRNVSMLMPMPHRAQHDSHLQRYQETGVPHIIGIGRELEARKKNGRLVPIDLAITEYRYAGQHRYVGTIREITDRKNLERTLKFVSGELIQLDAESIFQRTALFVASIFDAHVVFISKRCDEGGVRSEVMAWCEDEVLKESFVYDLRGTPCGDIAIDSQCYVESGLKQRYPDAAYIVDKDVDCYFGMPLQDDKGKLIGTIALMDRSPRTDRRLLELILGMLSVSLSSRLDQLHRNLRLFDMFEFSPDAILVLDGASHVQYANKMAATLFQRSIAELCTCALESLFRFEDRVGAVLVTDSSGKLDLHARISVEGAPVVACLPTGDGPPVEIALSHANSVGEALVIITARDIGHRRALETRARRTQRLEAIGTLTGGIAHDLNNSLAPILMAINFLRAKYPGELEFIDMMQTCVERASGIVRQLVAFAKGTQSERVELDLSLLVREMEKIIRSSFPKGIKVRCHIPENVPVVQGDATQLHQVLFNLCCNARDAMPDGGTLLLEVDQVEVDASFACSIPGATAGTFARLTVQDTGFGMTQESQEHIFEPFFTTKTAERGTGLGLSTALAIVRSHRGFITCHSSVGEGSTLRVYLPALRSKQGSDAADVSETSLLPRGNMERVLFVEDDAALAEVAQKVLSNLNYGVELARDGVDALIRFSANRATVRVVITDIHMPHMDGIQLVRAIRSISREVPIIVVSGRIQEDLMVELRSFRVSQFLDKPFSESRLAIVLKEVLDQSEQQPQISNSNSDA